MKLEIKIKYALLAIEDRPDILNPVHQNYYGEGFLTGLDLGLKLRKKKGEMNETVKTKVIKRRTTS